MLNLTQTEWREAMTLLDQVMDLEKDEQVDALRRSAAPERIQKAVQRLLSHEDDTGEDVLDQGAFNLVAPIVKSDDEFDATAARALETLGSGTGGRRPRPGELKQGTTVGSFRVEHLLGRGGMGEVYLAKRVDDFDQDVALKLVRVAGLGSEEVERRFKRERQILAGLRHENIARLIDGGVTEDRRPYLAMEYVNGEKITDYADRNGLNIDERMALFEQACRAVRYAHRRAIIHRDLKPSNLMVEEQRASSGDGQPGTGKPVVKLLDFGIAKLLEADDEPLTRGGERLMTPEYAAPEQVSGDPVTTSTDVYQLGVLMYELLTGRRPFYDVTEGKSGRARVRAAEDAILGKDPERPSRVMTRSVETLRRTHGMDPKRLAGRVRGDLDAIVQKALRKEPSARYSSVTELLEDIDRYRNGHPVQARSGTWSYRAKKFLRRNRTPVIAGGVAALILIGFVVSLMVTTSQLSTALAEVRAESERRESVQGLFMSMVGVADPNASYGDTLTVRDMLNISQEKAAQEFKDSPELKAWAYTRLAGYENRLQQYAKVVALTDTAITLYKKAGADVPGAAPQLALEYVESLSKSADASVSLHYRAEAIEKAREAIRVFDQVAENRSRSARLFSLQRRDKDLILFNEVRVRTSYLRAIQRVDSVEARKQALRIQEIIDVASNSGLEGTEQFEELVPTALGDLADYWQAQGDIERAKALFTQKLKMEKRINGENSYEVAMTLNNIGVMYGQTGNIDDMRRSVNYLNEALVVFKKLYAEDDIAMVRRYVNLGAAYLYSDSLYVADSLFASALRIAEMHQPQSDVIRSRVYFFKADVEMDLGQYEEAAERLRNVARVREENLGRISTSTARAHARLAEALWKSGSPEALRMFEETYEIFRALHATGNPDSMVNAGNLPDTILSQRVFLQAYQAYLQERGQSSKRCQILQEWEGLMRLRTHEPSQQQEELFRDLEACDTGSI